VTEPEPWITRDSINESWTRYNPNQPTQPRLPGQLIAAAVVLILRGSLGLLLTFLILQALDVHSSWVASWVPAVLWFSMGFAAVQILCGVFLFSGRSWPRMLAFGALGLDTGLGLFIMSQTSASCAGLSGVAVDLLIIALLSRPAVKEWYY
jgi:hypothetical protein